MKKIIMVVLMVFGSCLLWADITEATLSKIYTPRFDDWLWMYLSTINISSTDYSVTAYITPVEGTRNFKISVEVFWKDTPAGRLFISRQWPAELRALQAACEYWTRQGYPIDFLRDVEVTVQEAQ